MSDKPKRCFVIMPFGEKVDVDGKTIDFDRIYDVIHDAVTGESMRAANGPPFECDLAGGLGPSTHDFANL
jgi:hypothetical protein